MAKGTFDLRAWALVGAQQRLRELDEERAAIFSAFPQLRRGTRVRPRKFESMEAVSGAERADFRERKRRKMSKEARAKIAAAQRRRWKKQKAAM